MSNSSAPLSSVPKSANRDEKGRKSSKFPEKLHRLLKYAEESGEEDVISWMTDNTSFKVRNKKKFVSTLMPKFFNSANYKSFQRNLNLWGFVTVPKGADKGKCSHPLFIRDKPKMSNLMTRVVVKGWSNNGKFHGVLPDGEKDETPSKVAGSLNRILDLSLLSSSPGPSDFLKQQLALSQVSGGAALQLHQAFSTNLRGIPLGNTVMHSTSFMPPTFDGMLSTNGHILAQIAGPICNSGDLKSAQESIVRTRMLQQQASISPPGANHPQGFSSNTSTASALQMYFGARL